MDIPTIIGLIAVLLGGGGLATLLYARQQRDKMAADTNKTQAEADGVKVSTMTGVIGVLRGEIDRLFNRVDALEKRVTALECENRGLRHRIDRLRVLVQKLWALVCENDLEADGDLAEAVFEALEESAS